MSKSSLANHLFLSEIGRIWDAQFVPNGLVRVRLPSLTVTAGRLADGLLVMSFALCLFTRNDSGFAQLRSVSSWALFSWATRSRAMTSSDCSPAWSELGNQFVPVSLNQRQGHPYIAHAERPITEEFVVNAQISQVL